MLLCYWVLGCCKEINEFTILHLLLTLSSPMCVGDKDIREKDRVQYFAEPATSLAIQIHCHFAMPINHAELENKRKRNGCFITY